MAERGANIADRVQHVGADDEVERTCGELLIRAWFFEIENLALDFRESRQLLQRAGKECRGDIGERVGVQAALEQRQHLRRQAAGAAADFENAQSAAFRQMSRGRVLHGRADRCRASGWCRGRRRKTDRASPRRCRRTAPAPRPFHLAGSGPVRRNLPRKAVLREDGPDASQCRTAELRPAESAAAAKPGAGSVTVLVLREQTARSRGLQPSRSKARRIGAATRSESAVNGLPCSDSHFAQPTRELRGSQIVIAANRRLKLDAATQGDDPIERVLGRCVQLLQRQRRERWPNEIRRRALPSDVIDQIARAPGRTERRAPETLIARKPSTSTHGFPASS